MTKTVRVYFRHKPYPETFYDSQVTTPSGWVVVRSKGGTTHRFPKEDVAQVEEI